MKMILTIRYFLISQNTAMESLGYSRHVNQFLYTQSYIKIEYITLYPLFKDNAKKHIFLLKKLWMKVVDLSDL